MDVSEFIGEEGGYNPENSLHILLDLLEDLGLKSPGPDYINSADIGDFVRKFGFNAELG